MNLGRRTGHVRPTASAFIPDCLRTCRRSHDADRTVLLPNPDVRGTSMEGETVLLDLNTGRYYTLNRLGSVIWEHCMGHNTIRGIHAVLCDRFEVAPERALDDLVALINQLVQEGLLQQERR